MKSYLYRVIKLYLLMLFILSFSSTILSPNFRAENIYELPKIALMLFIYRFNIFSIFSLLFATLFTIQTYEKQNVSIAISISGMHSFRIMRPILLFSLFLSIIGIFINQFFLGAALQTLKKETYLSTYNKKLHVHPLKDGTIFYKDNHQNFTYIDSNKDIFYAASATASKEGFHLHFLDHFIKRGNIYKKHSSKKYHFLKLDTSLLKKNSPIKNSESLWTLCKAYLQKNNMDGEERSILLITLAYRIALPLLNIFSTSLASIIGFSMFFRRRYYFGLSLSIFLSLFFFYLLECTAILATGNVLSPFIFIAIATSLLIFPPLIFFARKV